MRWAAGKRIADVDGFIADVDGFCGGVQLVVELVEPPALAAPLTRLAPLPDSMCDGGGVSTPLSLRSATPYLQASAEDNP